MSEPERSKTKMYWKISIVQKNYQMYCIVPGPLNPTKNGKLYRVGNVDCLYYMPRVCVSIRICKHDHRNKLV